jgi:NAD(P)-dependent dehydrogenase (short-subunit alcohol dehydrogenase family)
MARPVDLTGKCVIVTGAAQGIGAMLALGLSAFGAKVALADIADAEPAARRVREAGGEAVAIKADVASQASCKGMVEQTLAAFGRLDGLVCNAALFATLAMQPFDEIEVELWDRVMAVNARGPWLCARAATPAMTATGGGSIIMISTNRVFQGFPMMLHYDASKGAVLAMARSLARELGPRNIRVNTIAPGLTMSEGVKARPGIEERAPAIARGRALSRDQQPEDLVGAVGFFLSDASAFVTGQSLIVDGGGLMS